MTTTLVDTISGDTFYFDLPILQRGMLLSIHKKFAARRITDVQLYINEEGNVYKQILMLGTEEL